MDNKIEGELKNLNLSHKDYLDVASVFVKNLLKRDETIEAQKEIIKSKDEIIRTKDRLLTEKQDKIRELKLELKAVGDFLKVCN